MAPELPIWLAWPVVAVTGLSLALLLLFAAHRMHLLRLSRRTLPREASRWEAPLPMVTVQLPIYNEAEVVTRLVDAAARLDYPRDRLQIQLLDDSTDETRHRAARRVAHWRERGVQVEHHVRERRRGFKAGALAEAMPRAQGEFILILDADFVPPRDLIRRLLPPFMDPEVGMVQARWDHLNEEASLLTRCQALLLDAHFFFEQGGRYAGRRFMSFNGTAGMWRRQAIEEAGGWSWDTLTEDLDLSYRCQMEGWRFVFLPEVGVPAEIPEEVRALEVQQKRWGQGGIQGGRKILPRLLRGRWPLKVKLEAAAHLMAHLAQPLTLVLGVMLLPSAVARRSLGLEELLVLDLLVFAGATLSFLVFYSAAGRRRGRPWATLLPTATATLALGIGLNAVVSGAVLRGLGGDNRDPFIRTPKRGERRRLRYRPPRGQVDRAMKWALASWLWLCALAAVSWGYLPTLPFLLLFGLGYTWLLVGELLDDPGRGLRARVPGAAREAVSGDAPPSPVGVDSPVGVEHFAHGADLAHGDTSCEGEPAIHPQGSA